MVTFMTNFSLQTAKNYIDDLTTAVDAAQRTVYITNLVITDDGATHDLIEALKRATHRGVKVAIAADIFTYSELGGAFSPFKRWHAASRAAAKMAKNFQKIGADFTWLGGNYKFNPFAGLTHIKWTIVDDIVYCFGGVNLYQFGIEHTDYMLKTKNPQLASTLKQQQKAIVSADNSPASYQGFCETFDFGTVYIDSGKRGQSMIYDRVCELASQSKDILFVSQYCPSGKLVDLLRNSSVRLYFNPPSIPHFPSNLLIWWQMRRTKLATLYKRHNYLHAKFIIFTLGSGEKVAITGSHNFDYDGVRLGTREVGLETKDPKIIAQLERFLQDYII